MFVRVNYNNDRQIGNDGNVLGGKVLISTMIPIIHGPRKEAAGARARISR
jgi:hypothetical protein